MKKIILILIVLILLPSILAQEFNDYGNLVIETKLNSSLNIEKLSSNYELDYVYANLTLFPRNTEFQTSNTIIKSNPDAQITEQEDFVLYYWNNPKQDKLEFNLESKINSNINFKEINEKVKFPILDVDLNGYEKYLIATESVTSNDLEIKKLASELAEGEDDLYNVVWKIALWTNQNINYSLETLTAEVSQNATWVLENRKGVCDELTSLFVAMLRSLKIPARFAVGQSYTNMINGFGNHAWAEVYFPSYGWVAFDPTYGQYGYVDATHIKMKDELDVKESSINYGWRSYKVNIEADILNVESKVLLKRDLFKKEFNVKLEILENDVGPDSYVPIKVSLINPNNFYLPYTFYITKAPNLIKSNVKNVLIKPGETKNIFFLVNINQELEPGFIYTSKIEIQDIFNNTLSENLRYANTFNTYSLENAQDKINALKEEEIKIFSREVDIECSKDKDFYYNYEKINLNCKLYNLGNTNLENLDICLKDDCQNIDLNIAEEKEFNFIINADESLPEAIIKAENQDISKTEFIKLNVLKLPNLKISNLDYPGNVNYNNKYNLEFILVSDSEANNVEIKLGNTKVLELEKFNGKQRFNVEFQGKNIYKKDAKLEVDYKDKNNVNYNTLEELQIQVGNIPIYTKFWFWIAIILLIIIISMILQNKLRR